MTRQQRQQHKSKPKRPIQQQLCKEDPAHLPEWKKIFGSLREEAEGKYPDGRLRFLLPEDQDTNDGKELEDGQEAQEE